MLKGRNNVCMMACMAVFCVASMAVSARADDRTPDAIDAGSVSLYGRAQGGLPITANGLEMGTANNRYVELIGPIDNGSDYTVSFWARPDTKAMDENKWGGFVVCNRNNLNDTFDFQITYSSASDWRLAVGHGTTRTRAVHQRVLPGEWQHVVGVVDSASMTATVYVNGEPGDAVKLGGMPNNEVITEAYIGTNWNAGESPDTKYYGDLKRVRFYRRALAEKEVVALYRSEKKGDGDIMGSVVLVDEQEGQVQWLLNMFDLDRPGLEKVKKAAADSPAEAAAALLAYYRARTDVRHPVDRSRRETWRGDTASSEDMEIADDALRNILIAAPVYPRHDFGENINWLQGHRDNEWRWQLHRHHSWMRLGRAYAHTGDERYAQAYAQQLSSWLRACLETQRPSIAWRRIEMGLRGRWWTYHFQCFLDSPAMTPDLLARFLLACHEHGRRLSSGSLTGGSNWGLIEAEGLAFLGMIFPEFKAASDWRTKAIRHLNREIRRQVRADGHQIEQTMMYHRWAINWFANTAELARLNGMDDLFPETYWQRIEAMCEVLLKLGLPDGQPAQFAAQHSPLDLRAPLKQWGEFFDRPDFLYVATEGRKGTPPRETAFALKDSGFYSMRSGWDANATMLVLKCGPGGGFHDQPDNGTFEVFAGGRRLTPDSGTYTYGGDAAGRRWFRQTRVHQTLTLEGRDTAQAPSVLAWEPGPEHDVLAVENRSYDNLAHRRTVLFVNKSFFLVVDDAVGPAAGDVFLHFQLALGDVVYDRETFAVRTDFPEGVNLLIRSFPQQDEMALEEEKGQVSFRYGEKEPRPAFRFQVAKTEDQASVRFVTLLIPYEGTPPETGFAWVEAPDGVAKRQADIVAGKRRVRVALPAEVSQ